MDTLLAYAQENSGGSSMFSTLTWVATAVGLWKMFEKAGEPGWAGIIPFYNMYKLCDKVMGNPWYWLRLFVIIIPVVGWIAYIYFQYQIGKATARAFGQEDAWAWGYTFLSPVFYLLTGFGNYKYYGVMGSGDTRTVEARQAKTVDFDVVKDEEPDESEVEFNIDQPVE